MSQRHYRSCHLCETMCGIEVEYEGEKILAIRADKDEVLSQGNICPKATGLQDIHTDPDRLRKPLRRVRKNPELAELLPHLDSCTNAPARDRRRLERTRGPSSG